MEKYKLIDANQAMQQQIVKLFKVIFDQMELPEVIKLNDIEQLALLNAAFDIEELSRWANFKVAVTNNNKIVGVAYSYDGAFEHELKKLMLTRTVSIDLHPDIETQKGEWYLEMLVIDEAYRGQGLGKKLLAEVYQQAKDNELVLSLNVDYQNVKAQKLYQKQGFTKVGVTNIGQHQYVHMQKK